MLLQYQGTLIPLFCSSHSHYKPKCKVLETSQSHFSGSNSGDIYSQQFNLIQKNQFHLDLNIRYHRYLCTRSLLVVL